MPGRLAWHLLIAGLGLALLLPVIPFSLELFALRRLQAAIALVIALTVLGQVPAPGAVAVAVAVAVAGIVMVVIAGIGAERTSASVDDRHDPAGDTISA